MCGLSDIFMLNEYVWAEPCVIYIYIYIYIYITRSTNKNMGGKYKIKDKIRTKRNLWIIKYKRERKRTIKINGIKGPFNISKHHFEIFGKFLIKGFDLFYVISKLLTLF
jgi:hypothetical protein